MKGLTTPAAVAAILLALIHAFTLYYFAAIWAFPYDGDPTSKMAFLYKNQVTISIVHILVYVVSGGLLAILVAELHHKLKSSDAGLGTASMMFGVASVALLIGAGMLFNAGLNYSAEEFIATYEPDKPLEYWITISTIAKSVATGAGLAGGLWAFLISIGALDAQVFSKPLSYVGMFVGLVSFATLYPDDLLIDVYRVAQVVWLLWLGVFLFSAKYRSAGAPPSP